MKSLIQFAIPAALALGLVSDCAQENRDRLFLMVYPNLQFEFEAGLNPNFPQVKAFAPLPTNFVEFAQQNGVDTSLVAGVFPLSAQLRSLDGALYGFVNSVSVLVCPANQGECNLQSDEVFYIEPQLQPFEGEINLQPGLRSALRDLKGESFRLELVFFLNQPSPFSVESLFEMRFEAVR